MIDVTAILLAHNEGRVLVDRALQSLVRSVEYAEKSEIHVEILIVLDRPDKETADYFESITRPGVRKIKVDCGDPGLSRNCGVQSATGRYVAFLDGDNLISEQWLFKAFRYLETANQTVVAHPEYHVFFDQRNFILKQVSSNSPSFKAVNLLMTNFWDTVAMSRKEIYLNNPFVETIPKVGLGYEDWHFDCETITCGIEHHVVPDTVHFMRSKETGSVCRDSLDSCRLLPPTKLLQPAVFKKYYEQPTADDKAQSLSGASGKLRHKFKQFAMKVFPPFNKQVTEVEIENNLDMSQNNLPKEIQDELLNIDKIEPLIHLDVNTPFWSHEYADNSIYTAAYYSLCETVSDTTGKFILLICDTSSNFSDSIKNIISDLIVKHNDGKIIIIDTCSEKNQNARALLFQDEVIKIDCLDGSSFNGNLSMLISIFILNANPESVYLLNSKVSHDLYERYGNTIKVKIPVVCIEPVTFKSASKTPVKTVIINTSDIQGGAARAAYRLHRALAAEFVDSSMLVANKTSGDCSVFAVKNEIDQQSIDQSYVLREYVPRYSVYENRTGLSNTLFSIPYPAHDISTDPLIQSADLINLHWVAFFQSPVTIHNLLKTGKPVIWTLHDMNPFTGGCHYSAGCDGYTGDCKDCPQLVLDPYNLPHAILKDKLELFAGFPLTIVTPSNWLGDCARKSSLFRNCRVEVIPNCIETDIYTPISKNDAKTALGIDPRNIVLMFGADSSNEKRKGFVELENTLAQARANPIFEGMVKSRKITVLSLGPLNADTSSLGLDVKALGHVDDDTLISRAYSAADIFILPSLEDNLPNMMLESMACGTPVLAFRTGGIPDVVQDGINGVLVPVGDVALLSERLVELVTDKAFRERLGAEAVRCVHEAYTPKKQAERYYVLFEELKSSLTCNALQVKPVSENFAAVDGLDMSCGPNFEVIRHKVMLESLLRALSEIKSDFAGEVLQAQCCEESRKIMEMQLCLKEFQESISWRLTKPLRWLGDRIRRSIG